VTSDLPLRPLAELADLLARGEIRSRDIVEACLARIDEFDGKLHAFIDVYRAEALARADAADRARRERGARGLLAGLPVALKDLLDIEGRPTTAGSKSWRGRVAKNTASAVERLVAAGMIPLGKTHMVEFAFGGWGRNEPMGAPWNPWDLQVHRVAGGSSSGSAVAVAGGLAPAAIGSDTGGSIRIPSALCGLTGLKPTYGLVSMHGTVPLSPTLDSIGPLAHTADDVARLTAAIAGPDPCDPTTQNVPRVDFESALTKPPDIRGTRITALAPDGLPSSTMPDVIRAYEDAIAVLRSLGATIDNEPLPLDFNDAMVRNGRIIAAEAYRYHREYIEDAHLEIDPWVRKRVLGGKAIGDAEYADELTRRRRAVAVFGEWMRARDALVTPTLPITATPVVEVDESTTTLATWTRAANYLGVCALSLPAGFSADGLPIGVQLTGGAFGDATLVRLGRAFQQATDWHRRRPRLQENRAS
jgi:aspartyl-tRNA(Asn)/glutamyl-tRNA(Gln) amidotransferase subunit A